MIVNINNKKHKIKPASELTVKEYIDYFSSINEQSGIFDQLMYYLSTITGLTYNEMLDIDISNRDISRISAYIGNITDVELMVESDEFYHKKSGRTIYKNSLKWRTLGARVMLEEKKLNNHLEQCVYLLACYIGGYDAEKVSAIYDELQDYRAVDVFGFIVFFFKKLLNG